MIWLQLSANTGPAECCLAVVKALALLEAEAQACGVQVQVLESLDGPLVATLSSVLVALDDPLAGAARAGAGMAASSGSLPARTTCCKNAKTGSSAPLRLRRRQPRTTTAQSVMKPRAHRPPAGSTSTRPTVQSAPRISPRVCRSRCRPNAASMPTSASPVSCWRANWATWRTSKRAETNPTGACCTCRPSAGTRRGCLWGWGLWRGVDVVLAHARTHGTAVIAMANDDHINMGPRSRKDDVGGRRVFKYCRVPAASLVRRLLFWLHEDERIDHRCPQQRL